MKPVDANNKSTFSPFKLLLIGIFPLAFFIAHLIYHYKQGATSNILWMCNISNLTLSLGLFLNQSFIVRVSALWLILGFPLWIIDLIQFGQTPITTFLVHIGGGLIALYVLKQTHFNQKIWIYSFGWYLIVQQFCRMFTPSLLNVNLAHTSRSLLSINISTYILYWIITCLLAALLFVFGFLLYKTFPVQNTK